MSIERVYVEAPIYDEFVSRLVEYVSAVRQGGDIGPMAAAASDSDKAGPSGWIGEPTGHVDSHHRCARGRAAQVRLPALKLLPRWAVVDGDAGLADGCECVYWSL
ncbi:hypothetical protein [Nocardia brasiliensis]|uniref:hypothetical protein n=1 Tax=Nocardia brasiliensis TaxID=37326 RepID=UPI003CC7C748